MNNAETLRNAVRLRAAYMFLIQRHRHRLTHGGRSHPNNLPSPVEVEWICSRNPLRIDLPEQLSLLEV